MEKRLVLTRADEDVAEYTKISHPIIQQYANRCSAKFEILEDCKGLHKHYRIMQLYDIFEDYDRILVLDSDILIRKDCPNLFETVPEDAIGIIFEDQGSREEDRLDRIKRAQELYGDIGWTSGYINTGVALFPKISRDAFKYDPEKDKLWMDFGYDDVFLGWRFFKMGIEVFPFNYKLNFMSLFSEPWSGKNRSEAYIIHYAGQGHNPNVPKPKQMKNDYLIMKKYGMI